MSTLSGDANTDGGDHEDPAVQRRALAHLSEVLEFVSTERKAIRDCPDLVQTESNPLTFLRFENTIPGVLPSGSLPTGESEKEFFGERAFRPMDLSGRGALNEVDVDYIASGKELIMITTGSILDYERMLASDTVDDTTWIRIRFFFLQKLIDPCMQAGKGARVFVRGYSINLDRIRANQETRLLIEDAFPFPHIEALHLAFVKEKNQTLWQYIVAFGLQQAAGSLSMCKVYNCNSLEELAESFLQHNISRSSLPVSFGGSYNSHVNFAKFLLDHGYPAVKLNQNPVFGPHAGVERKQELTRNHRKRTQDDLDNLVDYFISKAPELLDTHDLEPLGPSDYLRPVLTVSNSIPAHHSHQTFQQIRTREPVTAHGNSSPTINNERSFPPSRSVVLSLPLDIEYLSEYQCLLRQHMEFFEATNEDITSSVRGQNAPIALGQVGIRCRHCAHLPRQQRREAASYFPTKLDRIYPTALDLARTHLMDACEHVPMKYRQQTLELCVVVEESRTRKEYWFDAAQICGVVEKEGMLRF